jgi:hypothetical protein
VIEKTGSYGEGGFKNETAANHGQMFLHRCPKFWAEIPIVEILRTERHNGSRFHRV